MGNSSSTSSSDSTTAVSDGQKSNERSARSAEDGQNKSTNSCFLKYITAICRLWGIVLIIGLWGCMVQSFRRRNENYAQYYLLGVAVLVTFLEIVWILDKCINLWASTEEGRGCCRCWKALLWIDDWKKSIVYILLTAPCFTSKLRGGFSILAACLLLITAALYFVKSFRECSCGKRRQTASGEQAESADQRANLLASEQRPTYDSITPSAMPPATVDVVQANAPATNTSHGRSRDPRIIAVPVNDPQPPQGAAAKPASPNDDENVPVGYKHDYSAAQNRSTSAENRAASAQNRAASAQNRAASAQNRAASAQNRGASGVNRGTSVQEIIDSVQNAGKHAARPRINPFDDDNAGGDNADNFEHTLKRPTSTNPFEEGYTEP